MEIKLPLVFFLSFIISLTLVSAAIIIDNPSQYEGYVPVSAPSGSQAQFYKWSQNIISQPQEKNSFQRFLAAFSIASEDPQLCRDALTGSINHCGIVFQSVSNHVNSNATYTLSVKVTNTNNAIANLVYDWYVCRCDEKEGDPAGICWEYYPFINNTGGGHVNNCLKLGTFNETLAPGEMKLINSSVTQYQGELCGTFQNDVELQSVNGDSSCGGFSAAGVASLCESCIPELCGDGVKDAGEQCDDGNNINGDGCSSSCKFENVNITLHKIVCNSESDLPNWASTNITINNQTAQDFINSHQNCYFQENWSFQWWIGKGENNPGDNTGFSPLWHNITPTDSSGKTSVIYPINDVLSRLVWFREVFQSGYVPFTGINTNQNVSAEFYCHDDVQFYDNREGITFTQEGNYAGDYYCIAFNAKNETQPFCGDGIVQNGEQCELPNTETCSSECKTIERNLTCVEAKNLGLLTGSILGGNALVINNANQSFEVGLAVYEKFDENIDNQSLFDSDTGIVLNNSNLSLSVSLPSCQYQIDLFCGPVLQNFSNGTRYAERLLAAGNGGEEYCANEECGNGIKEGNEQCDDGNTNNIDSCTNQCLFTICGDGIVNNNEQCDDGNLNNSDGCTNQCILEFCGDGVKQDNESCDDGNNNNTDSCNNQCQNTFCGDYIIQSGEQCEPPNTNSCDAQCLFTICGDGIVQVPNGLGQNESCDDGNTNNTDSCNNQCEFTICGDGLVNGNEQCDDGNNNNTDSCTNQCILEFCGDGVKQDNESCDDGNNVNGDGCSVQCNLEICGDSIIQPPEVCDDGNQNNTDSCRNDCSFPICGDGIKDVNEACDDGNNNNTDSCTNQCNFPICGDGIVNNGEQCDDGNQVNKDACDNSCQFTICGDGIRQLPNTQGQYEECDDGNNNDNDACSNSCTANECIDLDQDEVCDHEDMCLDSDPGEPVDSMGCDIFQFCMTKGLSCGYECFYADWKNNEPNEQFPRDCTVVVPLKNGIESQPICVPTVATEMCAN